MSTRFWLSWYQPTDDYRPLTDPPHPQVLGWWCSGFRCDDEAATLCACVEAETDEEAKVYVRISWPEATEWRFCEEKAGSFVPGDRFPLSAWMKKRFKKKGNQS